jgi:hypothetical protein
VEKLYRKVADTKRGDRRLLAEGFYDHALRKEEDIRVVAEYIINNPVRAGLVKEWRDYPFSWHRWM